MTKRTSPNLLHVAPIICGFSTVGACRSHSGAAFEVGRVGRQRGEEGPPGTEVVDGREPECGRAGSWGLPRSPPGACGVRSGLYLVRRDRVAGGGGDPGCVNY